MGRERCNCPLIHADVSLLGGGRVSMRRAWQLRRHPCVPSRRQGPYHSMAGHSFLACLTCALHAAVRAGSAAQQQQRAAQPHGRAGPARLRLATLCCAVVNSVLLGGAGRPFGGHTSAAAACTLCTRQRPSPSRHSTERITPPLCTYLLLKLCPLFIAINSEPSRKRSVAPNC